MFLKIRSTTTILVLALLVAGTAQAWAPPARPLPAPQEEAGVFAALWDWLVSLVGTPEIRDEGESVQRKSGCGMDPDGTTYCK